jgi:hypothetical protein
MGLFDRAKEWLGMTGEQDGDEPAAQKTSEGRSDTVRRRDGRERPALKEVTAPSGSTVDDAIAAREAGDFEGARKLLREMDRGQGLRTVLRAAAALEANDDDELSPLLPAVAREVSFRLLLQLAGALEAPTEASALIERAAALGAPAWALAWARTTSSDEEARRRGLVDLLFADAALARTVARRDLDVASVEEDPEAAPRYASFAHGRDSIRRFGATTVARLIDRAVPR